MFEFTVWLAAQVKLKINMKLCLIGSETKAKSMVRKLIGKMLGSLFDSLHSQI